MDRLAAHLVLRSLRDMPRGRLKLVLPDGRDETLGRGGAGYPSVRLAVRDWAFFRRLLLDGETGAGASYIEGEWTCDDLVALIRLAIANQEYIGHGFTLAWLGRAVDWARHRLRRNTLSGARRNIGEHYDLSNDFFALFLDASMTYSCAVFEHSEQTLEEAQRSKYRRLAEKARLGPGDRVLEIGCGWGGFAEFAAREYGCRVVGITISQAQLEYARERIRRAGLDDLVELKLIDYRRVRGDYDKIVSIEMLEAVGHEYLPAFFRRCDELLAPHGLAVIQVITIPDQRYLAYRRRPDYIQKFVFPGSHLPSLEAMTKALANHTALIVDDLENIGVHYAETLRRWRQRFLERSESVRRLGFDDRFLRLWEFYLAYCEGGFAARYINDLQLVLTRAANPALGRGPYGLGDRRARRVAVPAPRARSGRT
ncbi:MAG: cyclopropane-fatty-acyl-phospholipid synthase family protein [Gemmatimonadales bacterium]|jgi:cyclopropane-fatty-acyl-phospholipid synthase